MPIAFSSCLHIPWASPNARSSAIAGPTAESPPSDLDRPYRTQRSAHTLVERQSRLRCGRRRLVGHRPTPVHGHQPKNENHSREHYDENDNDDNRSNEWGREGHRVTSSNSGSRSRSRALPAREYYPARPWASLSSRSASIFRPRSRRMPLITRSEPARRELKTAGRSAARAR